MNAVVQRQVLSARRIWLAFAIALAADGFQLFLGPFGWGFFDEIIDVIAMLLLIGVIGFHPLLLPTFVVEFIPMVDMLPTWTACVAVVVALRRRQQQPPPIIAPKPPPGDVIDV